jgi:crotonobetainyl-CoA:carnitine CoA-transferase CaiB-like acyl-CoA transferase
MLAVDGDDAFARFCHVAGRGDLPGDRRFTTARARADHRRELEDVLAPLFLTRTAHEWESMLIEAGVGCIVADSMSHFAFLYEDPQAQAVGMMTKVALPSLGGPYWRYAPVIELSDTPGRALPFCEFGEHTRALLAECGYDDARIDQLHDDGVIAWHAEPAAAVVP